MHVKIGPYCKYVGPYQIAAALFGFPDSDWTDPSKKTWRHHASEWLGDRLAAVPGFCRLCEWIESKRSRTVYVRIDNYDVWNMDSTLALIIGPMFVKLKQQKHGSGLVDDADAPEHLRSTAGEPAKYDGDIDSNLHARYDWLLDEMIWVFTTDHDAATNQFYDFGNMRAEDSAIKQIEAIVVDREKLDAYYNRLKNGYRLFGKYYQTFWD